MPSRMEIEKDIERCDTDNMASAALPPLRGRSHRFCGSRRGFVTDACFDQGKSLVSFVLQVRSGKKGVLGSAVR